MGSAHAGGQAALPTACITELFFARRLIHDVWFWMKSSNSPDDIVGRRSKKPFI
jgi:hypothetical protein